MLPVKENHPLLWKNIDEYIQDDCLRKTMYTDLQIEKIEIDWKKAQYI